MYKKVCCTCKVVVLLNKFIAFFAVLVAVAVAVACAPLIRDFKIRHYGRLGQLDRCHVAQNTRDLLPSSFWDGMFSRVSRREDNGETGKSSCILIVTFLLKLSSYWVKYALACVYIDLPIGEVKKKF